MTGEVWEGTLRVPISSPDLFHVVVSSQYELFNRISQLVSVPFHWFGYLKALSSLGLSLSPTGDSQDSRGREVYGHRNDTLKTSTQCRRYFPTTRYTDGPETTYSPTTTPDTSTTLLTCPTSRRSDGRCDNYCPCETRTLHNSGHPRSPFLVSVEDPIPLHLPTVVNSGASYRVSGPTRTMYPLRYPPFTFLCL